MIAHTRYQIFYSPYQLKRKLKPNALTDNQFQEGCLIKIEDETGSCGYADLCPWPTLGDVDYLTEIKNNSDLFQRSLFLAQKDLQARKNKISLLQNTTIKNNIILPFDFILNFNSNNQINLQNHSIYKIKVDAKNSKLIADFLNQICKKNQTIQFRLDANFSLTEEQFKLFIAELSESSLKQIEYFEDPFVFNSSQWAQYTNKIQLALDWAKPGQSWSYRIFKPARDQIEDVDLNLLSGFSLTSAMDHPVGIAHGVAYAQKFLNKAHGFLTLDFYEQNEYSNCFQVQDNQLEYIHHDYGIGFTSLLEKENWIPLISSTVNVLVNPRMLNDERTELFEMAQYFQKSDFFKQASLSGEKFVLVPSSGSTKTTDVSLKLIVLSETHLKNSAQRVVDQFKLTSTDHWGCVLPLFHVGGLGTLYRAQLSQAHFYVMAWSQFTPEFFLNWLRENNISCLSLVPTQLFDIVQNKIKAPESMKYVFIGGAQLSYELAKSAYELGWRLVLTFGMTETASMICYNDFFVQLSKSEFEILTQNENNQITTTHTETLIDKIKYYQAFEGVSLSSEEAFLVIQSNSNAYGYLQKNRTSQQIQFYKFSEKFKTQDEVDFLGQNKFCFLQRQGDYIKVLGEGVSLSELREKWHQFCFKNKAQDFMQSTVVHYEGHERAGHIIGLWFENISLAQITKLKSLVENFNKTESKPFEKLKFIKIVNEIPRTELFKIKFKELNSVTVLDQINI